MNIVQCKSCNKFFDKDRDSLCPFCGGEPNSGEMVCPSKGTEEKRGLFGRLTSLPKKKKNLPSDNTPHEATPIVKPNTDDAAARRDDNSEVPGHSQDSRTDSVWDSQYETDHVTTEQTDVSEETSDPSMADESELRRQLSELSSTDEGKTSSYFERIQAEQQSVGKKELSPVVGWLICVAGAHLGDSFNIYAQRNSVGRGKENKITIPLDNSVSRAEHAFIIYEPVKKEFLLLPGNSDALVYLNDECVLQPTKIVRNDKIKLGECVLMLIPLCGTEFSWEDYIRKE